MAGAYRSMGTGTDMKTRLADALQDCLAAAPTGRAKVEESLARYPDLAADLEAMLRIGQRLQEAYNVEPSPSYAQAARERFLAALASRRQPAPPTPRPHAQPPPPKTGPADGWSSPPKQAPPTAFTSER
jgi:uncharacterized membrane protein